MEDENGWKRLDLYFKLLAHPARAGLADSHGLELQFVRCERALNGVC
jgi:hypothetical protein